MSYQMKPDELLEALQGADAEIAAHFEGALCQTLDAMALVLARICNVTAGETTMQGVGFAGICTPFNPSYRGQRLPEVMQGYDAADAWEAEDLDLPEAPDEFAEWVSRDCGHGWRKVGNDADRYCQKFHEGRSATGDKA